MAAISRRRVGIGVTFFVAAGFLVLAIFVMVSAGGDGDAPQAASTLGSGAPLVETATPERVESSYLVSAAGRLRAREGTALIGEIAGKIIWISDKFILGGRLKQGDLLFRIDQSDYQAAVDTAKAGVQSAEATLTLAEKAYARRQDLVASGAVSKQANDDAVANVATAKAALLQAKAQLTLAAKNLTRTEIRSPFPARVIEDTVSLGTYVAPGQQLGIVTDTTLGELQAGLTPKDTKALAEMLVNGGKVKAIARPNSGSLSTGVLEGYIDRFNPMIDRASRTASIIALFPDAFEPQWDGKIFGDDFMTLEVEVTVPDQVWQLPSGSVRKDAFVWAVRNEKLYKMPVDVLRHTRTHSLVIAQQPLDGEAILVTLLNEEHEEKRVKTAAPQLAAK